MSQKVIVVNEEKGLCDDCGNYSFHLAYDEDVGIYRCRKCSRELNVDFDKMMREDVHCNQCGREKTMAKVFDGEIFLCGICDTEGF